MLRESEKINKGSTELHKLSTQEIVKKINTEDKTVAFAVEKAINKIANLADAATVSILGGGRVIYVGSGASGDLCNSDAQEISGTYGVPWGIFRSIHLQLGPNFEWETTKKHIFKAGNGGEDGDDQVIKYLKEINFTSKDIVIGVSASGTTHVIIKGLEWAKKQGASTGCVVMNDNSPMGKVVNYEVVAITGPEVVSGSTRMKAGTATKMILNALSTTIMVKLGNTYKGLMTGITIPAQGNSKLENRAIRIVEELTGLSEIESKQIYIKANQNVKVAVVSSIKKVSISDAIKLLEKNNQNLSKILD